MAKGNLDFLIKFKSHGWMKKGIFGKITW
jgi:hypothetical protein